jgi:vacuolar-type H+-ATPase subunit F/Vma7
VVDPVEESREAWVIGDAASVHGLELAGFAGVVAEDVDSVRAGLLRAQEAGARLTVLTEAAARCLDEAGELESLDDGSVRPLVTVLPSLAEPRLAPTPGERLRRNVRRALGIPGDHEL